MNTNSSADFPTVHVISDSVGETAKTVATAACAQFGVTDPKIEVFGKVRSVDQIKEFIARHKKEHAKKGIDTRLLVFFTIVSSEIRSGVKEIVENDDDVFAVDLLTGAVNVISEMTGQKPQYTPGTLRALDPVYYRKIAALEFTIEHDDGRNPQDLARADIVIIGVSRTSKTPTSIYLAQSGFCVANVPLDTKTQPPKELYDVDPKRLFGLMSTPDVLAEIRRRRIGEKATILASEYADIDSIYEDLESSRDFMRQLGCIVVHTDGRAVEETAQRILDYYHTWHD